MSDRDDNDIIYTSYRDDPQSSYSNRVQRLLSNANESDMESDIEREILIEYKKTLHQLKSERRELSRIRNRIKELSSMETTLNKNANPYEDLEETIRDIEVLVKHYERYLFELQTHPILMQIINRESVKAYNKQKEKEAEEFIKQYNEKKQNRLQSLNEHNQVTKREADSFLDTAKSVFSSILFSFLGLSEFYIIYGLTFLIVGLAFVLISYIPIINTLVDWLFRIREDSPDMVAMMTAVALAYFGTMATSVRMVKREKTLRFTLILLGICLAALNTIFLIVNLIHHDAIFVNIILAVTGIVIFYKGKNKE